MRIAALCYTFKSCDSYCFYNLFRGHCTVSCGAKTEQKCVSLTPLF